VEFSKREKKSTKFYSAEWWMESVGFTSVNVFVGESTTKWLHGYMSHTPPHQTQLSY
jgi:hypothetical protein